ncbi:MAG: hypothetical protein AAF613_08415 [Pseudomonadota bacterium]
MASRKFNGGLLGIAGALIGGYLGYRQAMEIDMSPIQGAIIFGGVGLVLGSAGGLILRTVTSLLVYAVLIGVIFFVFRDQIEGVTGIDPISSIATVLSDFFARAAES